MSDSESPHDEPGLEPLLGRFVARSQRIFARFRVPAQDAEDLLQEALLHFVLNRREIEKPEAWLTGTLRNRCLLYHRRKRRSLYHAIDSAILESVADPAASGQERSDLRSDLRRATSDLSPRCRSLLRLRYEIGYTPREAAARLGCRRWAVYKSISRCLAALTRNLVQGGETVGETHA